MGVPAAGGARQAVGALVIATTGEQPFTEEDLALAAGFADRAALAIDNAQLYADAQQRAREADFLAETAALAAGARAPEELLSGLARQATKLLGDGCGIFLVAPGRRWLPAAAIEHRDRRLAARIRRFLLKEDTRLGQGPLGERLLAGETVVANGRDELRACAATAAGRRLFTQFGIQSLLAVGLGSRREILGAMVCVRHGPPAYTGDDARLLRLVADRTGAALANALLHAAIEAEHTRLAALIAQLPEGVVIAAAPDARLVLSNRAAEDLLGRPVAGETLGEWVPAFRLLTPDGKPFPVEDLPLARALRGETVHGAEVWTERPDGRRLPLLVSAAPIHAPDGAVDEAVAVFHDIAAIKEAERAKDEWLSIASHELRTPITSIKGYTQFLERQVQRADGGPSRQTLTEALGTISRQVNRLVELVTDLLDVSRIQQGRLVLRRRACELRDLVRAAAARAAEADPSAGTRLQLDLPDELLAGTWDPDRLDQVLTNLIGNALKYDPSGGAIIVRVRRAGMEAVVEVQDRGIGVPADEIGKLFQPFARVGNVHRLGFSGIGLGLYISRDIVERHGGRIWAESEEGRGTTMGFALPLAEG